MVSAIVFLAFLTCLVGQTLTCPMGTFNNNGTCQKCTPHCNGGKIQDKPCTSNSDRECVCPHGKFWETAIIYCKICNECNEGEIYIKNCTHSQNSECIKCNEGTFAKTPYMCHPCMQCREGEFVKKKCTSSKDTICEPLLKHFTDAPPARHKSPGTDLNSSTTHETSSIQPNTHIAYICTIIALGIVIFMFAICCMVKKYKHKRRAERSQKTQSMSSVGSSENDTIFNKKVIPVVTHDPGILVRDVNPEIIIRLAKLLNPPGLKSWRLVAALLGFTQVDISYFHLEKEESFQKTMEAWGTTREATVYKLYQVFLKIERDDCAQILEDVLTSQIV